MTLPKTYMAAVIEKADAPFVIKDLELKEPKTNEVLVKVIACGVCHSDAVVESGGFGNGFPIIPGHEIIGTVAAVGPGVEKWKVGERVGGPWHGGHDGTCKQCNRGQLYVLPCLVQLPCSKPLWDDVSFLCFILASKIFKI